MTDPRKITILLADEDALRRDGLAAVLQGTARFEIVAQCQDGETALLRIRELRPNVAVVDLNIPSVHGIELVRRIRTDGIDTKVVILSASSDNDIIREVVRAGGDAYLLKNGPARHLIDAISYVCDGGQYFSPQLRRDGLDRHLLEETPRAPVSNASVNNIATNNHAGSPAGVSREAPDDEDPEDEEEVETERSEVPAARRSTARDRGARPRRPPATRRTSDPQRMKERLRESGESQNLEDRDYEILGMMADGIRPILDRLDEIEGRVSGNGDRCSNRFPGRAGLAQHTDAETFRGTSTGQGCRSGAYCAGSGSAAPQMIEKR